MYPNIYSSRLTSLAIQTVSTHIAFATSGVLKKASYLHRGKVTEENAKKLWYQYRFPLENWQTPEPMNARLANPMTELEETSI